MKWGIEFIIEKEGDDKMKREGILDKLAAKLGDEHRVNITCNSNGTHAEWNGNKIRLPKYCPDNEARNYIKNNWDEPVDKIKRYLKVKWGVHFIENKKMYSVCSQGEYTGSMEYVDYVTKPDGDGVFSVNIFVPWFGLIKSGSIDGDSYDVEYYARMIFELFKKCGCIFFINLNGKSYREKQNSIFVKHVSEEEFQKLLIDYELLSPEIITWKERYFSLEQRYSSIVKAHEEEINVLNSSVMRLEEENSLLKEKNRSLENEKDSLEQRLKEEARASDELCDALKESNNNLNFELDVVGQIHFVPETINWRRVKRYENGCFIYHQRGFNFDEHEGIEIIFLRKEKKLNPKQIVKMIPSLISKYSSKNGAVQAVNNFINEWNDGNVDHGIQFVQRNYLVDHHNIDLSKYLGTRM